MASLPQRRSARQRLYQTVGDTRYYTPPPPGANRTRLIRNLVDSGKLIRFVYRKGSQHAESTEWMRLNEGAVDRLADRANNENFQYRVGGPIYTPKDMVWIAVS